MNIYPLIRVILAAAFFIASLVILFNPEPLIAISPYAVEARHLLIAFSGTILYLADDYIGRIRQVNSNLCLCGC